MNPQPTKVGGNRIVLHDGYPQLMAEIGQQMLADLASLDQASVLVLPAAKTPFPFMFANWMDCQLTTADPLSENLIWQEEKLGKRGTYVQVPDDLLLPETIHDIDAILNPFGLQHFWSLAPSFAARVRTACNPGSHLLTLDWGQNLYDPSIASLPGIAADIQYSVERLLNPFGEETGWRLIQEQEIHFSLPSPTEEIAARLTPEEADIVRRAFPTTIQLQASVCYRQYTAI